MYGGTQANETYTSTPNPAINVVLTRGSPFTYSNFTTWYVKGCNENLCPGQFAVIFGAFVNGTETTDQMYINIVDCLLTYGTVEITQNGAAAPVLSAGSFQQNTTSGGMPGAIFELRRIYTDSYERSPYYFTGLSGTGDMADSLYDSPLGTCC